MSGFMAVFEEGLVKVLPQQRIEWLNETFLSTSTGIGHAGIFSKVWQKWGNRKVCMRHFVKDIGHKKLTFRE